jgi:acetyl-CoA carboxylase biotin carboxyl carrier protein
MNLKEIQTLIKFISTSKVDEVAIEQKDFKIKIRRNANVNTKTVTVAAPQAYVEESVSSAPESAPISPAAPDVASNTEEIKSPMIGTFYRKASPDKPSFVEVGDVIEEGQVICIIEAMKLFNEIESEVSGRIVKVLIDDSQPVEYDQPLFLVEPI